MTAARRRDEILQALAGASGPVSAAALAARLGVSRQVVVGDVALLRAAGSPIVATPRGYVLGGGQEGSGVRCTVACRHGLDGLLDELYTVADCGCGVLDVTVEHPVYGQLSGQLQVFSRYDADVFWDALQKNGAQPLCSLTGDIHLHTLVCPDEARKARVLAALEEKGYLEAELVREGNMPEKSVYRITPEGEHFFMDLMEKTARETVSIFLNFNAVIMNLDFMPEEKRKELLEGIHDGISDLKETIEVKSGERQHIPLTGRTILQQQLEMTEAMERWLTGFEKEYLKKK